MTTAPDLDRYTDTETMRGLLQRHLPGFADGTLHIEALDVLSAQRNTSLQRNPIPMTLCYDLQVSAGAARVHAGTQRIVAQVYRPGLAEDAFLQQARTKLVAPRFGQALSLVPSLDLLVWALPNDPALPQLPVLLDADLISGALPPALRETARAGNPTVDLLRYKPFRRATVRCRFADDTAVARERVLYGKTFFDDRASEIDAHFGWFHEQALRDPQAPLVAEPLGHDAATRTVWQAAAPGSPLLPLLHGAGAAAWMPRVATALAGLHAAPLKPKGGEVTRTVDHWLREVNRRRKKIARIDASLAERAARVAGRIEAHAARSAKRPPTLIHGDFHPDQFWADGERLVLFDFDEFTLGDPMEDLAEFIVKLDQAAVAPALGEALVRHYAKAAPRHFDAQGLAWHLAIQALLQAARAFAYQEPGWATELPRRLVIAELRARALS